MIAGKRSPSAVPRETLLQGRSVLLRFPWLYWLGVPLLAVAAYWPVLGIGFLADDFLGLDVVKRAGLDLSVIAPGNWPNFRPVNTLHYVVGWQLWGANPLLFHVVSLALHAGACLALGLLVATITHRRQLGWLSGALFAVFPAHLEGVGWLAASPDPEAALFGLLSLWLFVRSWQVSQTRQRVTLYSCAVLFYALSTFTKESFFTFIPLYPAAVWVSRSALSKRSWLLMAAMLLPLCAIIAANIGIRLTYLGNVGMYGTVRVDYLNFFWDGLTSYVAVLVSPINTALLGEAAAQVTGAVMTLALLVGLVLYGRGHWRLLLFSGAWVVLAILPVINLAVDKLTLSNNRYLYLPAAGYCILEAALLYSALNSVRERRFLPVGLAVILVLLGVLVTWVQLGPWQTATFQANSLINELARLVPPEKRSSPMDWFVQGVPPSYQGVWLFRGGIGKQRHLLYDETVQVTTVQDFTKASLTGDQLDAFVFHFAFDPASTLFKTDYAAGPTGYEAAPDVHSTGLRPTVWDFSGCAPGVSERWQARNAQIRCIPGKGLVVDPSSSDPQLVSPKVAIDPRAAHARYIRLRAAVRYPSGNLPDLSGGQWFWRTATGQFVQEQSTTVVPERDGASHVYWTFLPTSGINEPLTYLRFDPINNKSPVEIDWIAVDLVE